MERSTTKGRHHSSFHHTSYNMRSVLGLPDNGITPTMTFPLDVSVLFAVPEQETNPRRFITGKSLADYFQCHGKG
jgi:hypothetical protein